jgi:protoporphyrinogen oxidase
MIQGDPDTSSGERPHTLQGSRKTAVLGGGALGLTVALRLAQRGERVVVYEREPVAGGLAAGFSPAPELPAGGPFLEKFYHHLFRSDTAAVALIEELGLGNRLTWPRPVNAVLYQGQLWQPYTPLGLLRFSPLSLAERVRMGAVLALLKLQKNHRVFEAYTAHDWLRRWMGRRPYEVCWEPLLRAKFGERYDAISMAWFWARIYGRSFALGYLEGGFQLLYNALVAEIRRLGGEVHLGHTVIEAQYAPLGWGALDGGNWRVRARREEASAPGDSGAIAEAQFHRVVSTLPTRLTVRLVPQLPEEFRQRYDWGEAFGAHCLVLALDRPLLDRGIYWLNVNDPGYPFLVLVEHTNYIPAAHYGGKHLVYLGNYLPMDHPLFRASKEKVLAEFLPAVRRIVPAFQDSWVRESWAFGAPYAQPVVTREYPAHIPPFKGPLPDLWIGSMFQVYPQDRGQNYSIALANGLVEEIQRAE